MRLVGLILCLACVSCSAASKASDPRVARVITRTQTTTATYSLYNWNIITPPNHRPVEEWAAEFNSGSLHRVETPRDVVVADCKKMTGSHLSLVTGEVVTGPTVAKAACGIDANRINRASEWLRQVKGRFGMVDQLRLTDDSEIRTYSVAANGAIVAETISDRDGTRRLENRAVAVLPTVPSGDIFSDASLHRSVVPDEFKQPPARP